ncbi:MAG: hypothetical protein GZ093_14000 [Rhodoferax sp.]|uniref:hypothetical protein n=1 Tax=Rhodoferax sp. TaxID=50421 RepID=UPI001400D130|nr:hypothetical protein [Rhodoferax sp.]NDP39840.1 hypothetical protein [Rhodoferax sp.]
MLFLRQQGMAVALTALIGLSACGSSSDATQQTGVLLDTAVSGASYTGTLGSEGTALSAQPDGRITRR